MLRKERWMVLLLMMAIMICQYPALTSTVQAEEQTPENRTTSMSSNGMRYTYIERFSASLSISGGTAAINSRVYGNSNTTSLSLTVRLQRFSGSSWSTVRTFYGSGTTSARVSETYNLSSTGSYRIQCTAVANGWESSTIYEYSMY